MRHIVIPALLLPALLVACSRSPIAEDASLADLPPLADFSAPTHAWAVSAGGPGAVTDSHGIIVDSAGDSYITGHFEGTASFGSITLTSKSSTVDDVFVAKLGPDGTFAWAVAAGVQCDGSFGIAVDSAGNSYITGAFIGTAHFGTTTLTAKGSALNLFVAGVDKDGQFTWAVSASTTSYSGGHGITIDSMGNICVTGSVEGAASFGNTSLSPLGKADVLVAKLGPDGQVSWARSAGGPFDDWGNAVAVDSTGNSYVTGTFEDTARFGTLSLAAKSSKDVYVVKLDPHGHFLWARSAGGTSDDWGTGIAAGSSGNVLITGLFEGTVSFGATTLTATQWSDDAFVAGLNKDGKYLWATPAMGSFGSWGSSIVLDGAGNGYVTGTFGEKAVFGATTLTPRGNEDVFVAHIDQVGRFLWARSAGGSGADTVSHGVALDSAGGVLVTGYFKGSPEFGSTTLSARGVRDMFVAKLK